MMAWISWNGVERCMRLATREIVRKLSTKYENINLYSFPKTRVICISEKRRRGSRKKRKKKPQTIVLSIKKSFHLLVSGSYHMPTKPDKSIRYIPLSYTYLYIVKCFISFYVPCVHACMYVWMCMSTEIRTLWSCFCTFIVCNSYIIIK